MVAFRFLHRSDAELQPGDILLSPSEQAGPLASPDEIRECANWACYSDGQWDNVYFSMIGTRADEFIYTYGNRRFTYVCEPLGPCENDPEGTWGRLDDPSGSLRCPRAVVREVIPHHA